MAVPHILPSTLMNASTSAISMAFEAQSHTPLDRCVCFKVVSVWPAPYCAEVGDIRKVCS